MNGDELSVGNGFGGVPILGSQKPRIAAQIQALVRRLDDDGTYGGHVVQTPQGAAITVKRDSYFDGEELLAAIRTSIREEIWDALKRKEKMTDMLDGREGEELLAAYEQHRAGPHGERGWSNERIIIAIPETMSKDEQDAFHRLIYRIAADALLKHWREKEQRRPLVVTDVDRYLEEVARRTGYAAEE